jgi:hypothetical protein
VQVEDDLPAPAHPVLLIPGICGTQLAVRDKGASFEETANRVWVCIAHAVRSLLSDVDMAMQVRGKLNAALTVGLERDARRNDMPSLQSDLAGPVSVFVHELRHLNNS